MGLLMKLATGKLFGHKFRNRRFGCKLRPKIFATGKPVTKAVTNWAVKGYISAANYLQPHIWQLIGLKSVANIKVKDKIMFTLFYNPLLKITKLTIKF